MHYRTRTYIAGDWDHDYDAVEILHYWNDSSRSGLSFSDAHDLKQARDSSLNCTIKRSLAERLNASRTFVLIVGEHTVSLRAGSCQYCSEYRNSLWVGAYCAKDHSLDYRSYIEYECEKAVSDNMNIIVLYKSTKVDKNKCPTIIRDKGIHKSMKKWNSLYTRYDWDYQSVKEAFDSI